MSHVELIGVSADFLRYFVETTLGEIDDGQDLTTKEVCDQVVFPATDPDQCCYYELLEEMQQEAIDEGIVPEDQKKWTGTATCFVSHAWGYNVMDPITVMLEYAEAYPDTYFWFDVFINNQHNIASEVDFEWLCNTFKNSIAQIGKTLLVLGPWSNPLPLTRCWCLWELLCTIELQDEVELIVKLPTDQRASFKSHLEGNFDAVVEAMVSIDVSKAEAYNPLDKDLIFKAIEQTIGTAAMNGVVKDRLREWVLETCKDFLKELEESNQDDDLDFANFAQQVAIVLLDVYDDHQEALRLQKKVLEIRTRFGEAQLQSTGDTHICLGNIYSRTADTEASLKHYQLAKVAYEKSFGEDDIALFAVWMNLGNVYQTKPDYQNALDCYDKALKLAERHDADSRVTIGEACINIGGVLSYAGQHDEANKYYFRALQIFEERLGDAHPSTAGCCAGMSRNFVLQANFEAAMDYANRALRMKIEVYGPDHLQAAHAYKDVALVKRDCGEFKAAIVDLNTALKIAQRCYGEQHPDLTDFLSSLCDVHRFDGNNDLAVRYGLQAVENSTKCVGENHSETANSEYSLSTVYHAFGMFDKAIKHSKKSLRVFEELFGPNHEMVARSHNALALAHLQIERMEEAAFYALKAIDCFIHLHGSDHPMTANSRGVLAKIYRDDGKYAEAIEQLEIAERVQVATNGPEHPFTSYTYDTWGQVLTLTEKYDAALKKLELALEVRIKSMGETHDEVGRTLGNIADAYGGLKNADQAIKYAKGSYELLRDALGEDHHDVVKAKQRLERFEAGDLAVRHPYERIRKSRGVSGSAATAVHVEDTMTIVVAEETESDEAVSANGGTLTVNVDDQATEQGQEKSATETDVDAESSILKEKLIINVSSKEPETQVALDDSEIRPDNQDKPVTADKPTTQAQVHAADANPAPVLTTSSVSPESGCCLMM